jgi:hypothetical protein
MEVQVSGYVNADSFNNRGDMKKRVVYGPNTKEVRRQ